jgi:putative membrane protein
VTWFAGLFYIVRLFIYQVEASEKPEPDRTILGNQLKIMARKLWYIITWPSAVITFLFGIWMIVSLPSMLSLAFMQIKLSFVVLLYLYHFICHKMFKELQRGVVKYTSTQLRIFNEIATIILISVVFLIVLKDELNWIKGTVGFVLVTVLLLIAIKIYKRIRTQKEK